MAVSLGKNWIWLMTSERSLVKKQKRFYGRRTGKALNKSRAEALEALLPKLSVPDDKLTLDASLPFASLFDKPHEKAILEIGFGTGEHLVGLMEREPKTAYIGVEPFINGMATFLRDIENNPHDNIRVWMDDALMVVESLEDECLNEIYILNPDPWHKTRHHKRRIIRPETLDHYARILKPGGKLISSTDVPYLAEWIVEKTVNHPAFTWTAQSCKDWQERPDWWIDNKYATKGAKGADKMHYLIFEKYLHL